MVTAGTVNIASGSTNFGNGSIVANASGKAVLQISGGTLNDTDGTGLEVATATGWQGFVENEFRNAECEQSHSAWATWL